MPTDTTSLPSCAFPMVAPCIDIDIDIEDDDDQRFEDWEKDIVLTWVRDGTGGQQKAWTMPPGADGRSPTVALSIQHLPCGII